MMDQETMMGRSGRGALYEVQRVRYKLQTDLCDIWGSYSVAFKEMTTCNLVDDDG
jgi:hypothetical protein